MKCYPNIDPRYFKREQRMRLHEIYWRRHFSRRRAPRKAAVNIKAHLMRHAALAAYYFLFFLTVFAIGSN